MFHKDNPLQKCNLKFASDAGEFEGYASVFGSNDAVGDTIEPGAFKNSLSERMPKMFANHNHHDYPVGDWIDMKEDENGLWAVGKIDMNHRDGPTAYSTLKRGAIDGLSIGFTMGKDDFDQKDEGGRIIKNVNLMEVSLVNFPCEGAARISDVKHLIDQLDSRKDLEDFLRQSGGFSKAAATDLVGRMKHLFLGQQDVEQLKTITGLQAEIAGLREYIGKLNAEAFINKLIK